MKYTKKELNQILKEATPNLKKIVIAIIIGCIVWLFSTLYYANFLPIEPKYRMHFIAVIILYLILWIGAMILASYKKNEYAFCTYIGALWVSGEIQSVALEYAVDLGYSREIATFILVFCIILASISIVIAVIIGAFVITKKTANKMLIASVVGLLFIIIVEIIVVLLFGFDVIYMITSPLIILFVLFGSVWEGTNVLEKSKDGKWMESTIKFMLDLILIASRLFLWIIRIFRPQ